MRVVRITVLRDTHTQRMPRQKPHRVPIHIDILLGNLREQSEDVRRLEQQLADARAARDETIASCYEWIPALRLVKITGLKRESIYRIMTKGGQSES